MEMNTRRKSTPPTSTTFIMDKQSRWRIPLIGLVLLLLQIVTVYADLPSSVLNVQQFSFSLDSTYDWTLLDGSDTTAASALFQSFAKDLHVFMNLPQERVYQLGVEAIREADPYPEIVTESTTSNDQDQPDQFQSHSAQLLARSPSQHHRGSIPGQSHFSTQSLNLIRISFCFLPPGILEQSGNSVSADVYADQFNQSLASWRQVASGGVASPTAMDFSLGNVTRHIYGLIPYSETAVNLTLCDSSSSLPYYVICPVKDNTVYAGVNGLIASIVLAVVIFLIIFFSVWYAYTKSENRKRRAEMMSLKPELRHIIFGQHNTKFKQHTLDVWQPVWNPRLVTKWMIIWGGGLLLPLGIFFAVKNSRLVEVTVRYDNLPECSLDNTYSNTCNVLIPITQHMAAPIYMYYQLTNFYQNHRSYVMSRSDPQLRNANNKGVNSAPNIGTECAALKTFGDYPASHSPVYPFDTATTSSLSSKILYPCGLIASSFFNDGFDSARVTSSKIIDDLQAGTPFTGPASFELLGRNWDQHGIAWHSDRQDRFRVRDLDPSETNLNPRGLTHAYTTGTNNGSAEVLATMTFPTMASEDFIVWMRTAPFSTFAKLSHQILDRDLQPGEVVNITVRNEFDVRGFDGQKAIVLSTVNGLGSKNAFYGAVYLTIACVYILTGIILLLIFRRDPDPISPEETLQLALDAQLAADADAMQFESSNAPIFHAARSGNQAAAAAAKSKAAAAAKSPKSTAVNRTLLADTKS